MHVDGCLGERVRVLAFQDRATPALHFRSFRFLSLSFAPFVLASGCLACTVDFGALASVCKGPRQKLQLDPHPQSSGSHEASEGGVQEAQSV